MKKEDVLNMKAEISGFGLGYVPVTHEIYMNCNWSECDAGLGIAG